MSEGFGAGAARLAGQLALLFGWSPAAFWAATPSEVAALLAAAAPDRAAPPDSARITQLMKDHPDG